MKKMVVLDPGHGGVDSGAIGPNGTLEKDINFEISQKIARLLRNTELRVEITRIKDEYVSRSHRAAISNGVKAHLFVSLHCNASESKQGRGFEVYTSPGQTEADRAATIWYEEYKRDHPKLKGRKELKDGDPDKEARFTVLTKTLAPAYLCEFAFLDHPAGEAYLDNSENQERIALSTANAILLFFGYPRIGEEEKPISIDREGILSALGTLQQLAETAANGFSAGEMALRNISDEVAKLQRAFDGN